MTKEYQEYMEIDLSNFGYLEISQIAEVLEVYANGGHEAEPPIKVAYNGAYVQAMIIDSENRVFMENNGKLEEYYTCGE